MLIPTYCTLAKADKTPVSCKSEAFISDNPFSSLELSVCLQKWPLEMWRMHNVLHMSPEVLI